MTRSRERGRLENCKSVLLSLVRSLKKRRQKTSGDFSLPRRLSLPTFLCRERFRRSGTSRDRLVAPRRYPIRTSRNFFTFVRQSFVLPFRCAAYPDEPVALDVRSLLNVAMLTGWFSRCCRIPGSPTSPCTDSELPSPRRGFSTLDAAQEGECASNDPLSLY